MATATATVAVPKAGPTAATTNISAIWKFFQSAYDGTRHVLDSDQRDHNPHAGLSGFKAEWDALTEHGRVHIRAGILDGSLTY